MAEDENYYEVEYNKLIHFEKIVNNICELMDIEKEDKIDVIEMKIYFTLGKLTYQAELTAAELLIKAKQ